MTNDGGEPGPRIVRVLPDVAAIDKEFDYLVPLGTEAFVGDVVRIGLHGRRVGGWITAVDVDPVPGRSLKPLAKVSGRGPAAELIELSAWAAWRWAGRRASVLRTAAPPGVVRSLPDPAPYGSGGSGASERSVSDALVNEALGRDRAVLRLAPGSDRYPLIRAAALAPSPVAGGRCLVLCPSVAEATMLGRRLRGDGIAVAIVAHDQRGSAATGEWARAAAGAVVVGSRAAAWAPVTPLGRVVVLDEHDEAYKQEQSPTWHARDVVTERARRAGAPCLLVSPCPTLEALEWGPLLVPSRRDERRGWSRLQLVDQRDLDPALGPLFSPPLVAMVRGPGRILCILNRTGRARLLACGSCTTLARCEVCEAAVSESSDRTGTFVCTRCESERPMVCIECGGARFKSLRLGVSRAREELEALAGEPVAEVTAAGSSSGVDGSRILIGTEALLHRVARADGVAFLDFDQELLAPRYRVAEQALGLIARAARLVQRGGGDSGRVLVQTRSPDHPALMAAQSADPGRLTASERPLRTVLGMPPAVAMAVVSGASAPAFMESLGRPVGLRIQGPVDGAWRLVAPDHVILCDTLAGVVRPSGRLRIEVDPLRI